MSMRNEKYEGCPNNQRTIKKLQRKIKRLKWFPSYQSFPEIGIRGKRDDALRYRYLDFTKCKDKVVVDFGCNLGQTCVKAFQSGAKRVVGFDSQKDTIEMAERVADVLGMKIKYYVINFNERDHQEKILDILGDDGIDVSFFLSVYRTKELKDRDGLFRFIIDKTRELIFFEGHAMPSIDTEDHYNSLFNKLPIKYKFLGYTQENCRPFYEIYPVRK